ncbi:MULTISPECIES: ATP-binding cassette domain-containing protein [Pseudoalteromonas]|jgi:sodium transport system ATP-binding protein|uniref:ATP-binding cassette domain-containing protein n=1 Tax=Pseudoalteromonas TaxID=53246 RepID=UPI001230877C|nr:MULTISPECIES: ATP-binding cassette domain-containing protein [Pseudoalteromonas]MBB1332521.1 ATP-binding cassette domain-containing protein [Pseudoalteromonas sp. SR41-6]MBB1340250.1 ATP-binding cassette domain-containing protein [Pseudoalteromonas sp. SR45-6]MBB1416326.1 ATP-binding cassette domain-containing protein [Pseudoalteromonas sp. SG44-1]MBB1457889.1 ATP-binding cassette domain-containing protein [Pseudoalteromonas sp. SG41-8]MBB1469082.1 ATP-binding cassette domain-containing pro
MIEVTGLKKKFKLTKDHKKNKVDKIDPREDKDYFHSVRDVSFHCNKGEVLGLLGPNGAGKTTTLRMISTALKPDEGQIIIAGEDIIKKPLFGRKSIGFLSGSTGLYGRLTVKENIEYFAKLHGMSKDAIRARCEELFDLLDMHSFIDKRADNLSTGMKQKANIARAVVHHPAVVVLDEPTTGLDIMTTQTVIEFIKRLKAQGTPVIFSTHHLDEVALLCDRVAVINEGISCFDGSLDEFKKVGKSDELNQAFMNILTEKNNV